MDDYLEFGNLKALHLLWAVPALMLLFVYAFSQKKRALRVFAAVEMLEKLTPSVHWGRQVLKAALFLLAAVLIIGALSRPRTDPHYVDIQSRGRDIAFLLDVSKSMLANDLKPDRLTRAKLAIEDVISKLQGDRVALVAFAGASEVVCPLTTNYGFFLMVLDTVDVDSIAKGGSAIGDAINKATTEVFDSKDKRFKDVILITDGEDHDTFPEESAKRAALTGVRIHAVGLGDEETGTRIPVRARDGSVSFVSYQGSEHRSKLDSLTLKKIVNQTPGGSYLPVRTGSVDLGEIYENYIATSEDREITEKKRKRYKERFQILLGLALVVLLFEFVLKERRS